MLFLHVFAQDINPDQKSSAELLLEALGKMNLAVSFTTETLISRRTEQPGGLWPWPAPSQLYLQQGEELSDGCSVLLNISPIFNEGKF